MSSGRFVGVADKYLDVVLRGPSEWMCACPLCDGASSLQFNIDTGLWVCFRCEQGGSAKKLVRQIGGTYTDPAVSVEVIQQALDRLKLKRRGDTEEVKILSESYLARFDGDSPGGYWKSRGFSKAVRKEWGLGYDPLSDRCTIAYRNSNGDLLGVIQRRLDNEFPRYLYPKGFDRLGSIFGSWKIASNGYDDICLVEGSTDAIKVDSTGNPAGAQFGSSLGPRQIRLLRRIGVKKITLFYDYDEAGRKAEQQALEVLDGFLVHKVNWDQEQYCWTKKLCGCGEHTWKTIAQCQNKLLCRCGRYHEVDPGKLSKKQISQMIESRTLAGKKQSIWHTRRSAR